MVTIKKPKSDEALMKVSLQVDYQDGDEEEEIKSAPTNSSSNELSQHVTEGEQELGSAAAVSFTINSQTNSPPIQSRITNDNFSDAVASKTTSPPGFNSKVFLMTIGDRYQQYEMQASNEKVHFTLIGIQQDASLIAHELRNLHVTSIDAPEKKVLCRSARHYGFKIATLTGHRNLFFLSYQQMLDGVQYLLQAQNFANRLSQYTRVQQLPSVNGLNENWLVNHERTGKKLELKSVAINDSAEQMHYSLMQSELRVLQFCYKRKIKACVDLVDYFEEGGRAYLVTKYVGMSLRDYVCNKKDMDEVLAYKFLQLIAKGLQQLNERGITHRSLTLDAIKVRIKKGGLISLLLGQFDLATIASTKTTPKARTSSTSAAAAAASEEVTSCSPSSLPLQKIIREVALAPELRTSSDSGCQQQPLDNKAVDVWMFGQLAYQLLCCASEKQQLLQCDAVSEKKKSQMHYLKKNAGNFEWRNGNATVSMPMKELIAKMVLTQPQYRPNMSKIVEQITEIIQLEKGGDGDHP